MSQELKLDIKSPEETTEEADVKMPEDIREELDAKTIEGDVEEAIARLTEEESAEDNATAPVALRPGEHLVPPPTALRRGNNVSAATRPGAQRVGGTGALESNSVVTEDADDVLDGTALDGGVVTAEAEPCISAHIDSEKPEGTATATGESDRELYEGTIVPDRSSLQRSNNRKGWVAIAAIAVLGILIILLVVILTRSGNEEQAEAEAVDATLVDTPNPTESQSPSQSPTAAPTARLPPFTDDLPALVISAIENDLESPFYRANNWLLSDPNLNMYTLARRMQRFYLAVIFFATDGANWISNEHWLSYNVSECDWSFTSSYPMDSPYYEPSICEEDETLINLSLAGNNLNGSLPIWYTSFMPTLRVFDLSNNSIGVVFPPVTTSEYLEVINLSDTDFEGSPIVNIMKPFVSLRAFEWANAKVVTANNGGLYYIMPNLEKYNVNGMAQYQAPIYTSIGTLTNLQFLGFNKNDAYGTIPSELGLLTDLVHADLSGLPYLTGTLPSELGQLTQLTRLDLTGTPITGSLPANLCTQSAGGFLDVWANCSLLDCCQ